MKFAIDGYSLSYNKTYGLLTFSSNFVENLKEKTDHYVIVPEKAFIIPPIQDYEYIESLIRTNPSRIYVASPGPFTEITLQILNLSYKLGFISIDTHQLLRLYLWLKYILPNALKMLPAPVEAIVYLNQYALGTNKKIIHAAVIHDAMAWYYYRGNKRQTRLKQYIYNQFLKNLKQFDHIFSISITTKTDLICEFGFSAKKIQVIYENIAARYERFLETRANNPEKIISQRNQVMDKYELKNGGYILVNNPFNERKNSIAVLHASKIAEKHNCKIVFIGDAKKPRETEIKDSIIKSAKPDTFKFISVEDANDLPFLYQGSLCFCIFSLKEGFGLPPIEALASGALVISSRVSTMLEFMVGYDVWFVNPFSAAEIAKAVDSVLSLSDGQREKHIAKNDIKMQEFMAKYSWKKIINQSLVGLEAVKRSETHQDL